MTEPARGGLPLAALLKKLRLFRHFFSSLRKRGVWRTLKMSIFELYHERRLRADTSYVIPRQQLDGDKDALNHATDYFPSSYLVLYEAFSSIRSECRDAVLVDYGCGMGRALMVASSLPLKRMIGVEISQSLCAAATTNLKRLYDESNRFGPTWSIVNADARAFVVPEDANLFYFFNPFDSIVLGQVASNIIESVRKVPRKCTVVYANPIYEAEFTSRGFCKLSRSLKDFAVYSLAPEHQPDSV
jgi:hypothetical protein